MMYTVRYKSHHDASRALKERYTQAIDKEVYLQEILTRPAVSRRVVYLHVPFCNKVCSFCPFHRPDVLKRREYHEYIVKEIQRLAPLTYMAAPVDAINFGGGTPTALLPDQMRVILHALRENFQIAPHAEISVESSATELTDEMLEVLLEGGVNRLSIGIQSFQDDRRKMLGRRGSGEFAARRVENAIQAGISNTGIDLLYNLPGQTEEELEKDLAMIRSLDLAGISFYSLMIHEKTPLASCLTEEQRRDMADLRKEYALFARICEELAKDGYEALELTKLVHRRRDRYDYMRIRHTGGSCIAIGHGAGGNIEQYLYHNTAAVPILSEQIPISSRGRIVYPEYRILDQMIYDMQTTKVRLDDYSARLKKDLRVFLSGSIERMKKEGLLIEENGEIRMTMRGMFWGNNIIDEWIRQI